MPGTNVNGLQYTVDKDILKVETANLDLSGSALNFVTGFGSKNKQINLISIHLSTAVSRNIGIYVRDTNTSIDYPIIEKSSWNGEDLVITDKIRLTPENEIKITANQTSGTIYYKVVMEEI